MSWVWFAVGFATGMVAGFFALLWLINYLSPGPWGKWGR